MQDVYDYFYALSLKLGYKTFDYLPSDKDTGYPFVHMANLEDYPGNTKTELTGSVTLNIDCWGTMKQRLIISEMVERFFHASIGHIRTKNYEYYGNIQQQSKKVSIDMSVPNKRYLRGSITVELQIQ